MNTRISTFELEGRRYAVVPVDLLERTAPELLTNTAPRIPEGDATPWEIVKRTIDEEISKARAWREYLGLSQAEVASRLDISQSALSQIERQKRPRHKTLEKLAAALEIRLEQLR